MSSVFLPSNGSLVLPSRHQSYGYPVRHASYPTAPMGMGMGMNMSIPPYYPSTVVSGVAAPQMGVPTVVPSYGGSTVMMPSSYHHGGVVPMAMPGVSGYPYGASPYYGHTGQPTTIIIPSSSRKHRRSSSSHSHRRSRSRDYY